MAIHTFKRGESRTKEDGTYEWVEFNPPIEQVSYVGAVMELVREDYRAMSDVYTLATYALVIDGEGRVKKIFVNANFECDQSGNYAVVDATVAKLAHKLARDLQNDVEFREAAAKKRLEDEAKHAEYLRTKPEIGRHMEVVRGRKVKQGTTGVVAYIRDGRCLLKDPANWKDRSAPGVWVPEAYLLPVGG